MLSGTTDFSFALRQLQRHRTFTAVAVLTLALCIGANTAIFSLLNGVALRPLPYEQPDRLVWVWPDQPFTKALLVEFRESSRTLAAFSGVVGHTFALTGEGEPEEVAGASVSPGHFALLGEQPLLGRGFTAEEEEPGRSDVVVLSYALWRRRYGGDPDIIGRRIAVGGPGAGTRTLVGVMPAEFRPLSEGWNVWIPLTIDPSDFPDYQGTAGSSVLARVAPGATLEQADAETHELARRLTEGQDWISEGSRASAGVARLHDEMFGPIRAPLLLLLGAVALVLLIGCSNVTTLLLARAAARRRELAVRLALGARRARLVRQLLTENLLLALAGGAAGVLLTVWALPALVAWLPAEVPRRAEITVDGRVLIFALGLSILASALFGVLPALRATRQDVQRSLKEGGSTRLGPGRQRLNRGLVAAEIALAVVLVIGAGLMLKSFWRLQHVDPGFRADGVVTLRLGPPDVRYSTAASLRSYYDDVLDRLRATPGVASAGAINTLPFTSPSTAMRYGSMDRPNLDDLPPVYANVRSVAGDYFVSLGIPLVAGRMFRAGEGSDEAPVVLVNEALARTTWPNTEAVGREIELPTGDPSVFRVIGVVGDVRQHSLKRDALPEVYFPHSFWTAQRMYVTVRVEGDPAAALPALRAAAWSVDDQVPITRVRTMNEVIGRSLTDSRLLVTLLGAFALIALALGAVGVYGVTAYTVSQSTFDIGMRMALGAERADVLREVLGSSLRVAAVGVVVGTAAALAAARALTGFLFEVRAADPVVLLAVAAFLGAVAGVASYIPAVRASRVDPLQALRLE